MPDPLRVQTGRGGVYGCVMPRLAAKVTFVEARADP
jgi:hypothetical protein